MNTPTHELQPIAKQLRERQIEIDQAGKAAIEHISGILEAISEQGRDLLNAKTHVRVGKLMSWAEWLENNVPNLPAKTAAKYERITVEGITDPRQAVFAFLPEPDRRELPQRARPEPWEVAWSHAHRFASLLREQTLGALREEQREHLRRELEPVAVELWPDKFAGSSTKGI